MVAYSGNIISASSPTPTGPLATGTASGVWTLAEQAYWTQRGLWPIAGNVGARGLYAGGSGTAIIQTSYISISTLGNAAFFGNLLSASANFIGGCASATRGVFGGGQSGAPIVYFTIATLGNATTFGSLTQGTYLLSACNSSTRGVFGGGELPFSGGIRTSVMSYITIESTGNALAFGSLTLTSGALASCSSPTRGLFAGGATADYNYTSVIGYITIASTGSALAFGNLSAATEKISSCSSSTRGLFAGGTVMTTYVNTSAITYVAIGTLGTSQAFGSLGAAATSAAGVSSTTRAVFNPGVNASSYTSLGYVEISTLGNAAIFGTALYVGNGAGSCSNANGGL